MSPGRSPDRFPAHTAHRSRGVGNALGRFAAFLAAVMMGLSGVSCGSPRSNGLSAATLQEPVVHRFSGMDEADLVLRFYGWDSILVAKPAFRAQGFLRQISRDDLVRILTNRQIPRALAVVMLDVEESARPASSTRADLERFLRNHGFGRVVFLRADDTDNSDGLIILSDSANPDGT